MLVQIVIGSVTILATMGVMVGFVGISIKFGKEFQAYLKNTPQQNKRLYVTLSAAVLMVLIANTICIWIWAVLFRLLEVFPTFESAVYFALISFTTVGYGDLVADPSWRILTGFVSVNGLLAFGIFTAFLMEVVRQSSRDG
ncbi:MAG: potassium channel family protein [Rhizobiaceae bacterium]